MLRYLIILLDDTSTSFCHYDIPKNRGNYLIDLGNLKKGIQFAMMENLMVQFVYPKDNLPSEYIEVINSIDHIDIKPFVEGRTMNADVVVFNELPLNLADQNYPNSVFRLTFQEFDLFPHYLAKEVFQHVKRLSIVIKKTDPFLAWDLDIYKKKLKEMSEWIEEELLKGNTPQWNVITDRIVLSNMNNCGAGDTVITLGPNGKFYICPAFYYENMDDFVGDLDNGLDIPNKQLFKLEYAPICRHCDAYQCKRCIWLNRMKTLEVNTPSHEQCVAAHLERNMSRIVIQNIQKKSNSNLGYVDIKEIDYLDPFENREQWQQENM